MSLTKIQKIGRAYGIWWDLINLGLIVFLIVSTFLLLSLILIAGRTELLPYYSSFWAQFTTEVTLDRQSEIGLAMLGITVSGGSYAALHLIGVGTARWAMNRRIGQVHLFFAQTICIRLLDSNCKTSDIVAILEAFIHSSMSMFESISETHRKAQVFFECARMRSHILLQYGRFNVDSALPVAIDLFSAALVCQKRIELTDVSAETVELIRVNLIDGPFYTTTESGMVDGTSSKFGASRESALDGVERRMDEMEAGLWIVRLESD